MTNALETLTAAMTISAGIPQNGRLTFDEEDFTVDQFARAIEAVSGSHFGDGTFNKLEAALETTEGRKALQPVIELAINQGVEEVNDSTEWVTRRPIKNFRLQERDALKPLGRLKLLPRDGDIDYATVASETKAAYKPYRFARGLRFDAQDLIDDVYGVLNDAPRRLGVEAVATRIDCVYAELLRGMIGDENFFHYDVNMFDVALNADGIGEIIGRMSTQQHEKSVIGARPTHLIVGSLEESEARQALRALEVDGKAPLELVVEPRLDVGCIDPVTGQSVPGSVSEFYVVASQVAGLELGMLEERPRVRLSAGELGNFKSDFRNQVGSTGIEANVDHGFGAALCDRRGIFKGVIS